MYIGIEKAPPGTFLQARAEFLTQVKDGQGNQPSPSEENST